MAPKAVCRNLYSEVPDDLSGIPFIFGEYPARGKLCCLFSAHLMTRFLHGVRILLCAVIFQVVAHTKTVLCSFAAPKLIHVQLIQCKVQHQYISSTVHGPTPNAWVRRHLAPTGTQYLAAIGRLSTAELPNVWWPNSQIGGPENSIVHREPTTSGRMVPLSPIWQLGLVKKGPDVQVFAEPRPRYYVYPRHSPWGHTGQRKDERCSMLRTPRTHGAR